MQDKYVEDVCQHSLSIAYQRTHNENIEQDAENPQNVANRRRHQFGLNEGFMNKKKNLHS